MNTMMGFLIATLAMGLLCSASDFGGCFPEAHACKVLRRHWRHEHAPHYAGLRQQPVHARCPEFKLQSSSLHISNRSLSPWRYRVDEDKTRFPEKIAVAECLCSGCIINGMEDTEYNSVPVMQTMMIVRKKECSEKGQYSFKTEWKTVPVACTCVMHRSLSNA
ncbi:interleukin-17C [Clupea harengus]|uniref:Interleukin-17C n=1 Tax=Clupea harengus TaxID=7950 RepID=A0A6P3W4G5_CLUHA|nr:interleukin-17C [Clupea harengus]